MPDDDRKARLMALSARAGRTKQPRENDDNDDDNDDNGDVDKTDKKPSLTFRNYAPNDTSLDNTNMADDDDDGDGDGRVTKKQRTDNIKPSAAASTEPVAAKTGKSALQEALQEAQRDAKKGSTDVAGNSSKTNNSKSGGGGEAGADVSALAPQKIDADLKRGIADKLAKLERRTQRTIVEMLKERLELEAQREADDDDDDDDDDGGGVGVGGGGDSDLD